ncbi:hypothetical protein L1887_20872 [Cichorium endivia]|nr:hypothetical protein L1887_20872 [Cichorium endivia]
MWAFIWWPYAYEGPTEVFSPFWYRCEILKNITCPRFSSKTLIMSYKIRFNGFATNVPQEEKQNFAVLDSANTFTSSHFKSPLVYGTQVTSTCSEIEARFRKGNNSSWLCHPKSWKQLLRGCSNNQWIIKIKDHVDNQIVEMKNFSFKKKTAFFRGLDGSVGKWVVSIPSVTYL